MKACRLSVVGCLGILVIACARSVPAPAAPNPAPLAIPAPPPLPATLDEARATLAAGKLDVYEKALQALERSPDPGTSRRATELLALFYIDQKRSEDALPRLQKAADADPLVAPWMELRIAALQHDAARYPEAAAALQRILQQTPVSSAATTARIRLPGVQLLASDPAGEASLTVAMTVPIDELTEEEFVNLAGDLSKAGREDLAARVRMRLLTDYPQGRFTEQTYDLVAKASPSPLDVLSSDEALTLASKLGRFDRYDAEFDLLGRIAQRYPDIVNSDDYRSIRLRALFNSRRYRDILQETDEKALTDPSLMLLRARAAWRDDHPEEFLAGLQRIEKLRPKSSEAAEAKILRAKYYTTDQPDLDQAIENLEEGIQAAGPGPDGEDLWTLGWTYYLAKRYDQALQIFDRYGHDFPDGSYRDNTLFWSAKIEAIEGKIPERDAAFQSLLQSYPYSYYSYRARQILEQPPLAPNDVANGNVFPNVDAEIAAVAEPRLDAVRELVWLGLHRDAGGEMQSIAAAYPDNNGIAFMLADVFAEGGEPFKAMGILQRRFRPFLRHGGSGIPHRFWEILYPLKYWDTIRTEAEKRQLDPYLIAAIVRQESGFEPTTVSNAGAVGLMQIMPQEAPRIAADAGLPAPTREQLFNPSINLGIGVAEYSQKLAVMHGTQILAVAAYNSGEQTVGKWLAQTPVDDVDLFVESIPFNETRLYVKSVTRNRFEYRRIYEVGTGFSLHENASHSTVLRAQHLPPYHIA